MNSRLKIVIIVCAIVLTTTVFALFRKHSTANIATLRHQNPVKVKAITLAVMSLKTSTELSGSVLPQLSVILSAQITAQVTKVTVHTGDAVKKGQMLVALNPSDQLAASHQAYAALLAARSQVASAKISASMTRSLQDTRLRQAQAELLGAEAALKSAIANQQKVDAGPRLQVRQEAAQATAAAKAQLNLASKNLRRMQKLYSEGAVSAQQFDDYQAAYQTARAAYLSAQQSQAMAEQGSRVEDITAAAAQVQQARAAVQQAKEAESQARTALMQTDIARQAVLTAAANQLQQTGAVQAAMVAQSHTILTAPINGYVSDRLIDPGTMASPGLPLLQLQGGKMRLALSVPDNDLKYLHIGEQIPVHIAGRDAMGVVQEISPIADTTAHTLIVKIQLPDSLHAVSGEYGSADIMTGSNKSIMIPSSAIVSNEGLHYAYIVSAANLAQMRVVTLGQTSGKSVEILSGLVPGDKVIISNLGLVKSGEPVTVEGE